MESDITQPITPEVADGFNLSREVAKYELRRKQLFEIIDTHTDARKRGGVEIAKARAELRTVERLLNATKPRKSAKT